MPMLSEKEVSKWIVDIHGNIEGDYEIIEKYVEPKTGHWIAHEVRLPDRTILNYKCSVCGRKLIGYNTETLSEAPYYHCGAKMIEPQESEDKE